MAIQEYLSKEIEIQNHLLDYIDNENELSFINYEQFIQYFEKIETPEERSEFKSFLSLISIICNNHKRTPTFFNKIERILLHFKTRIKQTFSNFKIFKIFHDNKRLLLFLIENQIIELDQTIVDAMKSLKYQIANYVEYFEPEINEFEGQPNYMDDDEYQSFKEKRKIGENDDFICSLIQNDSIDEFIVFLNKGSFTLTTEISPSIFETNPFLYNKKMTLIEYSVFYGSIQIFQFLYNNKCQLNSSLWLLSIHGKNSEIIHFLEDNNVTPNDNCYEKCLIEAIKCHHNEIFNYINDNYININSNRSFDDVCYIASKSLKYRNFETFPNDIENTSFFYDLCQYDYLQLVEMFLEKGNVKINMLIVLNIIIVCLIKFQIFFWLNRISYHFFNSIFIN